MNYKICSRCLMDTTSDPNLELDENGVCNYCHTYDKALQKLRDQHLSEEKLAKIFEKIKRDGKGKKYDCILGMSGGVDSSYLAHLAGKYGLRVLVVHVDCGWNSELAVQNIEKMCTKLGFDLHTVVVDWQTMKELQRAFLFSGVCNQDTPQDHCFRPATNKQRRKFGIKYVLNGYNLSTEGILSSAFQYTAGDWIFIKDVYKKYGRGKISLRKYPHIGFTGHMFDRYLNASQTIKPLNYIEYHKKDAIELLEREYGWKYYGGKHFESRFTRFYQEVYLPQRYGWEKRRDHVSSLIVGGEMTREEGIRELETPTATSEELRKETEYVLKKLDISWAEWEQILKAPRRSEDEFRNMKPYWNMIYWVYKTFVRRSKDK